MRDGHETAEGGHFGLPVFVGSHDASCGYAMHKFAVNADGVDAERVQLEVQGDMVTVRSRDGEGLADGEQGEGHEQE